MNYKEKYKQALERAKKLYEQGTITESLGYVFPELKESEDERIKKTIIRFFKDNYPNETEMYDGSVTVGKALAWLEKQGEKKNTHKREIEDAYLQGVCDTKHEIEKQGKKLDADNVWLQNYISNVTCLVNQLKKDFGL